LITDVADVIERHGYERPEGVTLVDLRQALYRLLYDGAERP